MTQQPQRNSKAKRKPLGNSVNLSDSALDKLAEVTDADIAAAVALWESEAPMPLKNMLQAKVEESK